MQLKSKFYLYSFIGVILYSLGCQRNTNFSNSSDTHAANKSNCEDLIKQLILNSNFKPVGNENPNSLNYFTDDKDGQIITIGVSKKTEENGEVNIGWIWINLEKQELLDVTLDPDNPVNLSFSKAVFMNVKESCN